ncbi:hypothetical protein ACFL9S_08125 [Erwinia sp. AnSW2-5]|uniref:hypothetical protein n=1 Tax=Erwinia sp. AnSW2-5 TaxID=3367692 RepID=UPI0038596C97
MPSAPILWRKLQTTQRLNPVREMDIYNLSNDVAGLFRQRLQSQILTAAKRFSKAATRSLDALSGSHIYKDVKSAGGRHAALVTELFRNAHFISNSGSLDTATLHCKLMASLSSDKTLVFELGWGQAKRDAGQLRTLGANADIAEILAIARLIATFKAIEFLTGRKVKLRIITGGQRFRLALFIRPEMDSAYNKKREEIARWLSPEAEIEFDTIQSYWSNEEIKARLEADENPIITHPMTEEDFRFALFAIDWYGVLGQGSAHDMYLPSSLTEALKTQSYSLKTDFLRSVIALTANPTIDLSMINSPFPRELLHATSNWFSEVARNSADLYIRLGHITLRNPRESGHSDQPVLLTVIEKPERPDIPCFQLLGRRYGKTLPQHLTGSLGAGENILFDSLYLIEAATALFCIPELSDAPLGVTSLFKTDVIHKLLHLHLFDDVELS